MVDPRKHNYFAKIQKFIETHRIAPAQITEIDICHDDWCRIYRGGYCNCNPEIKLHPQPKRN
jgi:hypothetical protein